jgi:hypothetical protein
MTPCMSCCLLAYPAASARHLHLSSAFEVSCKLLLQPRLASCASFHLPERSQHHSAKMNMNGGQDWDTVVIRKKKPTTAQLKDESAVNAVGDGAHLPIMLACARSPSAHR